MVVVNLRLKRKIEARSLRARVHAEDSGLQPRGNGEPLQDFKEESYQFWFLFLKLSTGFSLESGS